MSNKWILGKLQCITREEATANYEKAERDEKIKRQQFDNRYRTRLLSVLRAGQTLIKKGAIEL
jgi:hypothetical protein